MHALGVDVLVAPYEADAQLAFLSKTNIAQIIITDDSDLIVFGCEKVINFNKKNLNFDLIKFYLDPIQNERVWRGRFD
jgi:5'-3' exonuclease